MSNKYIQCDSCLGKGSIEMPEGYSDINPNLVGRCGKCDGYGDILWIDKMTNKNIHDITGFGTTNAYPRKRKE